MAAVASPAFMQFVDRFQSLQTQRAHDEELIKDILIHYKDVEQDAERLAKELQNHKQLAQELQDTQLDLEDSNRSRRDLQQRLKATTQLMEQFKVECDQMRNRNAYVMVLVDGDGMIFNESLISQGMEGGKLAANTLRNSVLGHCGDLSDDIEVIAKVCANVTGLSKAMQRDGSLSDGQHLRDFTLGFTQGKASFDFVDVGHGKERADSKIKENLRWHLRNHNCKQIFLGLSHDAGYAPFLDEVLNQDDQSRVVIMEGPPTVRELKETGLQITDFSNIFRTEKLVNRAVPSAAQSNTWAGVTSAVLPPPSASPIIAKSSIRKSTPTLTAAKLAWHPGPRGLDPPVDVDQTVLEKIKRRTLANKLCNNHYLRGPCVKDECSFEHNYKASDEEIKAITYLTRLNPCGNGQDCDQEYCIYGHHCPSVTIPAGGKETEPVCLAFGCRFGPEGHPPNTTIKRPRKEKFEYERY